MAEIERSVERVSTMIGSVTASTRLNKAVARFRLREAGSNTPESAFS